MSAALQADDCTEPSAPCPCESVIRLAENLAHNTGWAVFPCRADKRPATEHGFLDAVSDPVLVADLWHRFPGPLIGIATGARSGFDVLDIDAGSRPDDTPKKAALRQAARAWWHVNASRIPRGRAYQTESGGIHVYFQHAPGVRNSESLIAQGIDVRGDGGYAIHWFAHGRECFDHHPPAAWPAWLLWAMTPKQAAPPPRAARRGPTPANVEAVIRRAIERVGGAAEGSKHQELRDAARLLGGIQASAGFSDGEAVSWLVDALPHATVRDWRNAEQTARWGLDSGRRAPLDTGRRGVR